MTPRPPNFDPHADLPGPDDSQAGSVAPLSLTAEQEWLLLDLAEGGLDDEAEIRAWSELSPLLASRPDLRRAVLAMRADRRTLAEWPEETTPASVSERARFAATQHAMATLARQAAAHDSPPTMTAPLRRDRPSARWLPMALAACAGLLVLGAVAASLSSTGLFKRTPSRGTMASNTVVTNPPPDPLAEAIGTELAASVPAHAVTDAIGDDLLPPVGEAVASDASPSPEPAPRTGVIGVVEPTRAVELAARGRLAVRVVLREPERSDQSLSALGAWASKRDASRVWRLGDAAPVTLASRLASPATVAPAPGAAPVMADGGAGQTIPTLEPATTPSATLCVMMVDTPSSEAALRALGATLEDRLGRVEWLEFAPEPGASPPPAAPHIESVLWWTQPTSRWAPWTSVPLIIDRW